MKFRLPWQKRDFTSQRVASLLNHASGDAGVAQHAAAGAAASVWSGALSAARLVHPADAVTPDYMGSVGDRLIRYGEAVDVLVGGSFMPVTGFVIHGKRFDPESWVYEYSLHGPERDRTARAPASMVAHHLWRARPEEPWAGVSPLADVPLATGVDARLTGESEGPSGYTLAMPTDPTVGSETANEDRFEAVAASIRGAKGTTLFVESTRGGHGHGTMHAPLKDWVSERFGINPPQGLVGLRTQLCLDVWAACNVPRALFDNSDGTAKREALRQWAHVVLAGRLRRIAQELQRVLQTPVGFSVSELWGSDVVGRTGAAEKLVGMLESTQLDEDTRKMIQDQIKDVLTY